MDTKVAFFKGPIIFFLMADLRRDINVIYSNNKVTNNSVLLSWVKLPKSYKLMHDFDFLKGNVPWRKNFSLFLDRICTFNDVNDWAPKYVELEKFVKNV